MQNKDDWLLAAPEDHEDAPVEPRKVDLIFNRYAVLINVHVGDQVIRTTHEHPFWVRGQGWTKAWLLRPGMQLRSHDGRWITVQEVFDNEELDVVYNLRVEEYHTYFVGDVAWGFSVWAHNTGCPLGSDGVGKGKVGPYQGKPGEVIDPSKVDVFRGGKDLKVKDDDIRIKNGLVQKSHGLSLNTDPASLSKFGGAHKVSSVPDELQIKQRGNRSTHFEIVPKEPMALDRFQELVNKVVLE